MNIIVCIDNNYGMMFNKRRQSQDKSLRNNIKNLVKNHTLYMNKYSYALYKDIDCGNIKICDNFLNICNNDDFCLVEDKHLTSYNNNINSITVYKWNTDYPSDFKLDIDFNNKEWLLINSKDFEGTSHNKITKETYRRKKQ